VRARAALAVGRIQDSTTVQALRPLLGDSSADVRHEAAFALGQIGHRSARSALESAAGSADAEQRQLAIEALGKLGDKKATPRVVRALDDARPAVRGAAAVALWRLADSTAVDALVRHDHDSDREVRWRVIWALEKVVKPEVIVLRAALLLEDPDPQLRAAAVRTIGRQKHPRGTAYALTALDDADVNVAVNAIRALQLIGDTTCAACGTALLAPLGHHDPYLRVTAATALADPFAWAHADSAARHAMHDALRAHLADPDARRAARRRAHCSPRRRGRAAARRAAAPGQLGLHARRRARRACASCRPPRASAVCSSRGSSPAVTCSSA
jgi:HEAT repeat protein